MKKISDIQRSYDEGFSDGLNSAIKVIESANKHHKIVAEALLKTLKDYIKEH